MRALVFRGEPDRKSFESIFEGPRHRRRAATLQHVRIPAVLALLPGDPGAHLRVDSMAGADDAAAAAHVLHGAREMYA